MGETPNLAARLQGIAEPNMVIIAESTRRLVGSLFELEDLGSKDLKGIAGPVRAWAAVRASSVESRFEALHAAGLTALVGREEETRTAAAALVESKELAKAKSCCSPARPASASHGSRRRCWNSSPASRIPACAISARRNIPTARFYPIIGQMERAAELTHDDKPQAKLDKLDALASSDLDLDRGCRALCRDAVAAERWTLSGARIAPGAAPAENARSADGANGRADTQEPGAHDLRGRALDRPHVPGIVRPGRGPDPEPPGAADRDLPPGVRAALDRAAACDGADHQPAWRSATSTR